MLKASHLIRILLFILAAACFTGCKSKHSRLEKEIVKKPEEMDDQITDNIKTVLQYAKDNDGKINDSAKLSLLNVVASYYDQAEYHNTWSHKEKWLPLADSLFEFIETSKYYGLFPSDYHLQDLAAI